MTRRPIICGKLLAASQVAVLILLATGCFTIVAQDQMQPEQDAGHMAQGPDDTALPFSPDQTRAFSLVIEGSRVSSETVPVANGKVAISPTPEFQGGLYFEGTTVKLSATPNDGYAFLEWEGDCAGVARDVCRLAMDFDKTVDVTFKSLGVSDTSEGPATVSTSP